MSNGIVSASGKVVLMTLDRSPPMKMNKNPVALEFNNRKVISSSRSTVCHKDEDRVPVNDSIRGVFFAIYTSGSGKEEAGS